jgi:hypothetical protein
LLHLSCSYKRLWHYGRKWRVYTVVAESDYCMDDIAATIANSGACRPISESKSCPMNSGNTR